jgi:hypothetical protein
MTMLSVYPQDNWNKKATRVRRAINRAEKREAVENVPFLYFTILELSTSKPKKVLGFKQLGLLSCNATR